MAFRTLQAIGSSATISIGERVLLFLTFRKVFGLTIRLCTGAGVISDITTPAERGGLIGTFGGSMRFPDPYIPEVV